MGSRLSEFLMNELRSVTLEQVYPQLNPHPCLEAMQLLARTMPTQDINELKTAFQPFLRQASNEEWQLLLQYINNTLLAPVEVELFDLTVQYMRARSAVGKDPVEVNVVREQPRVTNFVTVDASYVSRRYFLDEVMSALCMITAKKDAAERVKRELKECQLLRGIDSSCG